MGIKISALPVVATPTPAVLLEIVSSTASSQTTLQGMMNGAPSTTLLRGSVELATNAEMITGTDVERGVTPAGAQALRAYRRTAGTFAAPVTGAFDFATYPSGATIHIDSNGGAVTGTLPVPALGLHWQVKDVRGKLSVNALTVARTGAAVKIEGLAASYELSADFGRLRIECDGTDWWV